MNKKLVKLLKAVGITMIIVGILVGLVFGVDILIDWLTSINPYLGLVPLGLLIFGLLIPLIYGSL